MKIFNETLSRSVSRPGFLARLAEGCALSLLCVAAATSASAGVILGNLPATNDSLSNAVSLTGPSARRAVVFTMGSNSSIFTDVILRLSGYDTTSGDVAQVGIFQNNGVGNTGAQVGSFLTSPTSASIAVGAFTFTTSGPLTLAANQSYWLVVSATAGAFQWAASSPGIAPSGPLAAFGSYQGSPDAGVSWSQNVSVQNSFQINGTPEPGTSLLLGTGLAGLLGYGWRQRRRSV